jgi:hypothetical protein
MKPADNGHANMPQPIEGELIPASTPPHVAMPKRLRLTTARDVRRELHRLYELMMRGEVNTDTARTGGFLLRCMLESIRIDEIEDRLSVLENREVKP